MDIPEDLRYTREHEWARVDEANRVVTIGITDYAQSKLGDVVYVEIAKKTRAPIRANSGSSRQDASFSSVIRAQRFPHFEQEYEAQMYTDERRWERINRRPSVEVENAQPKEKDS